MNKNGQLIRVLVVDDSAFMCNRLSMMLMKCSDVQIVGTAMNGREAIEQAKRTQPDIMTLDIEMPGMNGLEVLDYMMAHDPLPIIMVSALTKEGAEVTFQALERGAVDFIAKPMNKHSSEIGSIEKLLHAKVREAFNLRQRFSSNGHSDIQQERPVSEVFPALKKQTNSLFSGKQSEVGSSMHRDGGWKASEFPLVVIGGSTGGPNLLKVLIREIPESFPAALLIVQHMPKYFTKVLAENLNAVAAISICEAQDGDELQAGIGFVAPGSHHVLITRERDDKPRIRFATDKTEYPYRPSIDCAMVSAAEQFGQSTVGLVVTGMGNDGLAGTQKIKEQGGTVLAQDEATSLIYGMPRAVVEAGMADAVLPDVQLARALVQAVDSVCETNKSFPISDP